jgi:SulP family sulfate permease
MKSLARPQLGDISGAVADLGVFIPLAAGLVLVNGINPASLLIAAGLLAITAGLWSGIPFPVQPLKALSALAISLGVAPTLIHAAGLELGVLLLVLSLPLAQRIVTTIFDQTVVRALQFGVGVLLVITAVKLVKAPPDVLAGDLPAPWPILLGIVALIVVGWAAEKRHYGYAIGVLAAGVGVTVVFVQPDLSGLHLTLPGSALPHLDEFGRAFWLLVIPQIPLTIGNAVVATSDVARVYFPDRGKRVTPGRVCFSAAIGNIGSALIGGMPMCHGAGGLTAHYRLGARTPAMNVMLGSFFLFCGLFLAHDMAALFGALPVWVLAAFLAYAGVRHALLIQDRRGYELAVALIGGTIGAVTGNLALTAGIVVVASHARRLRGRTPVPQE